MDKNKLPGKQDAHSLAQEGGQKLLHSQRVKCPPEEDHQEHDLDQAGGGILQLALFPRWNGHNDGLVWL